MFIDESYFVSEISIPGTNSSATLASLNAAIVKYEKEVLISVLGYELYDLFVNDESNPIYSKIIDGDTFTFEFGGKQLTRKWIGLKNSEKESLLAYYVYFMFERDKIIFNSNVGFVTPKVENADQDNPRRKFVNAYNHFVELAGDMYNVVENKTSAHYRRQKMSGKTFNKFDQSSYEFVNDSPSLFNFMLANIGDYPTWEFELQKKINYFDL